MNRILKSLPYFLLMVLFLGSIMQAQDKKPRKSPKSSASHVIGLDTKLTFEFCSPAVKGRTIWGELVPWGFEPGNKYSDEKPFPWRGGANENTTLELSKDVLIEGNTVPAGKYSLHFKTGESEWTIMINKVNDQWGSYKYDSSKDVASFTVKSQPSTHQEWLRYGFDDYTGNGITAFLHWEKVKVPFKIEVSN